MTNFMILLAIVFDFLTVTHFTDTTKLANIALIDRISRIIIADITYLV